MIPEITHQTPSTGRLATPSLSCAIAPPFAASHFNVARRRERHERAAGEQAGRTAGSATPLDDLGRAEQSGRVRSVLASLKRWQARILILRSSGLTYAELAEVLSIKTSSVGTMLARAEAQFQKQYVRWFGREE